MTIDPNKRLIASELLQHDFFTHNAWIDEFMLKLRTLVSTHDASFSKNFTQHSISNNNITSSNVLVKNPNAQPLIQHTINLNTSTNLNSNSYNTNHTSNFLNNSNITSNLINKSLNISISIENNNNNNSSFNENIENSNNLNEDSNANLNSTNNNKINPVLQKTNNIFFQSESISNNNEVNRKSNKLVNYKITRITRCNFFIKFLIKLLIKSSISIYKIDIRMCIN